jgi:hypothetical protein
MRHMSGPFRPSIVRQTATPRPRSDHLLHVPSAIHPSFQPLHNHFPNHPTTTPTITKPLLNHPSCRIQERFRLNHPSFVILQLRLNHNQAKRNGAAELPRETKFVGAHLCSIRIFGIILMFPRGSRSVSWRKGSPYGGEDPAISFYERH